MDEGVRAFDGVLGTSWKNIANDVITHHNSVSIWMRGNCTAVERFVTSVWTIYVTVAPLEALNAVPIVADGTVTL